MTGEEKLREIILTRYGSVREFSIKYDIPYSTLSSVFRRGIANAGISTIIKICDALHISADELAIGNIVDKDKSQFFRIDESQAVKIPVYGNIAAGKPIQANEDIEEYVDIYYPHAKKEDYIALRIRGSSMEPRMCEGDVVIIHLQPSVENGEIAAVRINNSYTDCCDATCKRVKYTGDGGIMLMSNNPAYEPMYFSKKEIQDKGLEIIGKVVEFRARY